MGRVSIGLGLAALLTLAACSLPQDQPETEAPLVTASAARPIAPKTPAVSPAGAAWEYAEHGRQRLIYLAQANEGNGYATLVGLKDTPGGLRDTAARAEAEGVEAVLARLAAPEDQKDGPFRADYELVQRAGSNRHLGCLVEVPEKGPITVPDSESFVEASSSLWLLPALEVRNANVDEQLQNFRTYLHIARAISLDAATVEHYEQGTFFLGKTLDPLARIVRSGKLSANQLRGVIAALQELVGSEIELQGVLDTEYFLAVRRLQSQGLDKATQEKEHDALAARFLKVRPLFADPKVAEVGFIASKEAPRGKLAVEWAGKQDFLPALARSRLALTHISAVKVLAALEAYKKEKKRYPDKVEDLSPAYLSKVPTDWFSAKGRFVYAKTPKGYKLESVSPSLPEAKDGRITW